MYGGLPMFKIRLAMVASGKPTNVGAVVLAAGSSRRMGTPKQLLRLGAKTLLDRVLDVVRSSAASETVLVLGASADDIKRSVATGHITVVINPDYPQGMGTSLRKGVAALSPSTGAALVVLGDQPFVSSSTLDLLIAAHHESNCEVAIPTFRGFRGNPVLIDRALFPEILQLAGDVGCRAIFGSHTRGIRKVAVEDPGILLDIDSGQDWQHLASSPDPVRRIQELDEIEARGQVNADKPELVIVGRDPMARALATLASRLDFQVTVVDPTLTLPDFPEADRILHVLDFAKLDKNERYVVVASRGQFDEEAVEQALRHGAVYTGLKAKRGRAEEISAALKEQGFSAQTLSSVRVPAGVDIGAETAEEIALSILAQIVACRRQSPRGK
jgi:molybdenum cofactor cytidylyltransferase